MIYALAQGATISQVGALPKLWWDGTRWHDWRGDTPATDPALSGWLPVTDAARPADTDTTTHDYSVELIAGQPVVTWTPRPWTAAELASRAEQDARLDNLAERVARIEAHLWPAPPDPTGPDDPTVTDWQGVWPDGGLLRDGGTVWRNISGVPLTTPPSGFPGTPSQWGHLFVVALAPDPEPEPVPTVAAWSATARYEVGSRCTRGGRLYECKVAHGAAYAGTWGPPAAGVWKDLGPA